MTETNNEHSIRRILVALDSSPSSVAALETAAELAADFKAKLEGIFIEDIDLLRVAQLTITQEVGLFSATSRRLEIQTVKRQLRGQAAKAEQLLKRAARQTGAAWSFRVGQGNIATELLAAAAGSDMVILGKVGWSPLRRKRLGSTSRALLSEGSKLTLILPHGVPLRPPALVVYNGSVVAQRALHLAARLMAPLDGKLTILLLAEAADTAQRLRNQATAWLEERGLTPHYLWREGMTIQDLARLIERERSHFLLLPGDSLLLEKRRELFRMLDEVECPVLLVR